MASKTSQQLEENLVYARMREPRAKREARLRKSVSQWARFWGNWYYIPMCLGLSLLPLGRCAGFLGKGEDKAAMKVVAVVFGSILAVMLVALAITFFAMKREVARWRAAQEQLPFKVIELEDCLADGRGNTAYLELRFTFAGAHPTTTELENILLVGEGGWKANRDGTIARLSPGRGGGTNTTDNRAVAEWFANLASGELLALHTRFPITSVRLVNGLWDD